MKNFLLLSSIILISLAVRLYNFENRLTYGPEQARSLVVSARYIKEKPSLLGQEYFRVNSQGHKLFTSALFNYSLVPLLLIFNYQVIPITYFFVILNVITGLVVYFLVKKMLGYNAGLLSLILYLFNSYMIYHSMFIWVLNYMPLIGILSLYLCWKIYKKKYFNKDIFFLGILSGIGFGFEYLYILAILPVMFVLFKYSKNKIKDFAILAVGGLMGDAPQILFDLKHNFYHLRTLLQYGLDTLNGVSDAGFVYYHFLHFWPLLIILLSLLILKICKRNIFLGVMLIVLYLYLNLTSVHINFRKPVGMFEGLNFKNINTAAKIISEKASDNFNVVTLYDFDTRGYTLRYLVEYVYGKKPMGEIDYPSSNEIFALAKNDYDFNKNNPWELNVYKPYNISRIEEIRESFSLYRITKDLTNKDN